MSAKQSGPRVGRIGRAVGKGLGQPAPVQALKRRTDWVRPTVAEMRQLKSDLEFAEAQRDNWRKTAKEKTHELTLLEASAVQDHKDNSSYEEHHTLHNLVSLLLVFGLIVSVAFNIWG